MRFVWQAEALAAQGMEEAAKQLALVQKEEEMRNREQKVWSA